MYRVFEALDELSAIVEEARGVPMTAGCMVPRGDVLELLDDIKDAIPGELDDAQDVLDARDAMLRATHTAPVARVLDLGTGCGIQAVHASGYADHVVGTLGWRWWPLPPGRAERLD